MRRSDRFVGVLAILLSLLGMATAWAADDKAAARDALRGLRKETLAQLYQEYPKAKTQIRKSAGYAVFGATGVHVLFVGASGGRGLVRDNLTGRDTYMRMGAVSGGLGIGVRDARTVLIFNNRSVLKEFLDKGWTFGGETAAVAKIDGQGGRAGELESPAGITIYQLTESGLMAKGSVEGTKYWKDEDLN